MEEIRLEVQVRKESGTRKAKAARRNHLIPAVVYGGGKEPTAVTIDRKIFEKISRQHRGENVIFHLNVMEGEKKLRDYSAITKEKQFNPVSDELIHIDFHRISLTEKIEVEVNIVHKGDAIGVKQDGGSLDQHLWKLDVVCLPTQIPHHIEVEVSKLNIDDKIFVKDLVLPSGVTTKHDPEDIVISVAPPMKEIKPEDLAAEAPELEVIKEKPKEKKEGEEAAAPAAKKAEGAPKAEGK